MYSSPNLMERNPIAINGIRGEMIVWTCKWYPDYYRGNKWDASIREVYFDYDGVIWYIEFDSHMDRAEQSKADFEHVLQTFKILN